MEDQFDKEKIYTQPPASLYNKTVHRLKSEGLIETNTKRLSPYFRWSLAIAASVLIFIAGRWSVTSNTINPEQAYMLLLHEDEGFNPGDPDEMFMEYALWMGKTMADGVNITGQELESDATLVDNIGNVTQIEDPGLDKVTGYFIVEAPSKQEAIKIAQSMPHLKYGGSIEIKSYMNR